jgi:hypothetical protein
MKRVRVTNDRLYSEERREEKSIRKYEREAGQMKSAEKQEDSRVK